MTSAAVLAILALLAGVPAAAEISSAVVDPYLKIQVALVHDSIDALAGSAEDIATAARTLGAPGESIDAAATHLAAATDLADARAKFGALSEAMESYRKDLHLTLPEGVRLAYCPMARKPWLQQGARIANPYYGTEMPTCGSFR
jgi:hypothetical protein